MLIVLRDMQVFPEAATDGAARGGGDSFHYFYFGIDTRLRHGIRHPREGRMYSSGVDLYVANADPVACVSPQGPIGSSIPESVGKNSLGAFFLGLGKGV